MFLRLTSIVSFTFSVNFSIFLEMFGNFNEFRDKFEKTLKDIRIHFKLKSEYCELVWVIYLS